MLPWKILKMNITNPKSKEKKKKTQDVTTKGTYLRG